MERSAKECARVGNDAAQRLVSARCRDCSSAREHASTSRRAAGFRCRPPSASRGASDLAQRVKVRLADPLHVVAGRRLEQRRCRSRLRTRHAQGAAWRRRWPGFIRITSTASCNCSAAPAKRDCTSARVVLVLRRDAPWRRVHAVAQRRDERDAAARYSRAGAGARWCGAGSARASSRARRNRRYRAASAPAPGRSPRTVHAARRRRDLDRAWRCAVLRVAMQQLAEGLQALRQALGVVEPVDAHEQPALAGLAPMCSRWLPPRAARMAPEARRRRCRSERLARSVRPSKEALRGRLRPAPCQHIAREVIALLRRTPISRSEQADQPLVGRQRARSAPAAARRQQEADAMPAADRAQLAPRIRW